MKTLRIALLLACGMVGVAAMQGQPTSDDIRNCARTACTNMRSCTTEVETTLVAVDKGKHNTQEVSSDCRQGITETYSSCIGELPLGRVANPNDQDKPVSKAKKSKVTAPRASTLRSANSSTRK